MRRLAVLPLILFAVACTENPTQPGDLDLTLNADDNGARVVQIVNGGGRADLTNVFGGGVVDPGAKETYGFTARKTASGEVSGHLSSDWRETGGPMLKMDIICLGVAGNAAYLGAEVTKSSDENLNPVGERFYFKVIDNGEGSAAEDDSISIFFNTNFGTNCENPGLQSQIDNLLIAYEGDSPFTAGNVQIHDKTD